MAILVKASVEDMLRGVRGWIGDGTTETSVDRIAQMFLSINDFVAMGPAREQGKFLFADRKTVEAAQAEAAAQALQQVGAELLSALDRVVAPAKTCAQDCGGHCQGHGK